MDVVITIKDFKIQLKARGYSESTRTNYSRYLGLFRMYLEELSITDLREVTKQVIDDYHAKVMSESIGIESKACKIRPVKRLFEYLTENHRLLINPTEGIVETTRKNRQPGTVLTLEEVKLLMEQPDMTLKAQVRNRAVMELMYSTAIRANELEALEVYNVDIKNNALYIYRGKGKKDRVVPIGKKAASYLEKYLVEVRPHYARNNPKERSLFLTCSGLPLSANSVRVFLTKYRNKAGIKKNVSPHTMRRTCATHLLQQGVDIRYIQELLGHKSLKTTQAYTKVMPVDVKETHNKTHPNTSGRRSEDRGKKKNEN